MKTKNHNFIRHILLPLLFVVVIAAVSSCGGGSGGGGNGGGGDTTAPTVISTSPASNAAGVAVKTSITVTFSEAMDPSTITTATFRLSGDTDVVGTVTYSGTTATFTPSAPLIGGTSYAARITTGVKDVAGNAMAADYNWVFRNPFPRFAYVTNTNDNTLSIYTIDAATGRLRHNGYITSDTGPRSVVVDPSGKYLYLVSFNSFTIKAYAINATNGALTLVNSLSTGTNPISVTVDPSGKFVYVANINSDNISAYSINIGTGALTDIGIYAAGNEPASVTVNPTGQYLYVANQNSSGDGSVSVFSINTSTGVLTTVDADGVTAGNQATIAAGAWPQAIILDPSGKFAYVPNWNSNNISAYRVDAGNGSLTPVVTVSSIGTGPTALAIDASGRFAYVSNQTSNNVSVFSINSTTGELVSVDADAVTGGTQTTIAADTAPLSVSVDITGKHVYVANVNANNLSAYSINTTTGALIPLAKMAARSGPIGIAMANGATAVSYTPKAAYVTNVSSATVSQFTIGTDGALAAMPTATVATGTRPWSVTVDPLGRFAFVTNFASNNISVYTINPVTFALTEVIGSPFSVGTWPTSVSVDPSGRRLYVSNYGWPATGSVSAYSSNPVSGTLTPVAGSPFAAGNGSSSIDIDPSGRFVYVTNLLVDTISAFSINPANGTLTKLDADSVTVGIQDLRVADARPVSITTDLTGRFVYVMTACGNAWVFNINAASGLLSRADSASGGLCGAFGDAPDTLAVDPTGRYLYAKPYNVGDSVSAFNIDVTVGTLTAVAGSPFATGAGTLSVMVDPSGRYAYATGSAGVYQFTIGANGALNAMVTPSVPAETNPSSIATTGTIQ